MSTSRHLEPRDCPDCGAEIGQLHDLRCDVEPCPYCGGQALQCFTEATCPHCAQSFISTECGETLNEDDRIRWTGLWPGTLECVEFEWFSRLVPHIGWVPCEHDHPDARPNLNRLHDEARWDREQKRFLKKEVA